MNERINRLIPDAIDAISNSKMAKESGIVPKEFKGYVSSMGASIVQAGLLPTLAFYANDSGKKANSSYLLDAITRLIKHDYTQNDKLILYVINSCKSTNTTNIKAHDLDFDKLYAKEEEITTALIAIKLALRTFKYSE
jgi:CRISPR-associated protein Cmr5